MKIVSQVPLRVGSICISSLQLAVAETKSLLIRRLFQHRQGELMELCDGCWSYENPDVVITLPARHMQKHEKLMVWALRILKFHSCWVADLLFGFRRCTSHPKQKTSSHCALAMIIERLHLLIARQVSFSGPKTPHVLVHCTLNVQ